MVEAKKVKKKIEEIGEEVRENIVTWIPPEFRKHLGNSKKEILLALRSLIDREIERTEKRVGEIEKKRKKAETKPAVREG
ncbi:MAG: hypothetical protein ACE5QV_00970 [Fidelibacterota bacterium]